MSEPLPPWLADLDPRWVRPDWKNHVRPDWQRFMPPGMRFDAPPPRSEFERLYRPYREEPASPPQRRGTALTESDILAFRANLSALRFKVALLKLKLKALHPSHYDPNQPRVPAGNPEGGEWTRLAGPPSIGSNQNSPLENPPEVPKTKPPTAQERNAFIKNAARWIARTARVGGPVGTFMTALEMASWLDTDRAFIDSYQDPPKTMQELQDAASNPKWGYHRHHVAERSSALEDGYSKEEVDGPENLALIPTLKHWEINGWYGRPNDDFGGMSPREYLKGKSWAERTRVGRDALIKFEVLKP
jgi:hypothetical protein